MQVDANGKSQSTGLMNTCNIIFSFTHVYFLPKGKIKIAPNKGLINYWLIENVYLTKY